MTPRPYRYEEAVAWRPAALRAAAETAGEQAWCRFFDALAKPLDVEEEEAPPVKRSRNYTGSVDITKTAISEAEAAAALGVSRRWLSEKRPGLTRSAYFGDRGNPVPAIGSPDDGPGSVKVRLRPTRFSRREAATNTNVYGKKVSVHVCATIRSDVQP